MSLCIGIDDVTEVLLVDGWHSVFKESFDLDAYEYVSGSDGTNDDAPLLYNGERQGCSTGFNFIDEDGDRISGPITSIIAIRRAPRTSRSRR